MASFTEEQKAFIRQVVYEAAPTIIAAHVDSCPWGKTVVKWMYMALGIGIALGALGILTIPQFVAFLREHL